MSLTVPRVIPDDSPILSFAVQGNLEGIKSLFSQGIASPYDVGLSNGRTALHVRSNGFEDIFDEFAALMMNLPVCGELQPSRTISILD